MNKSYSFLMWIWSYRPLERSLCSTNDTLGRKKKVFNRCWLSRLVVRQEGCWEGLRQSPGAVCGVGGEGPLGKLRMCTGWINHLSQGNPGEGFPSQSHQHLASACKCKIRASCCPEMAAHGKDHRQTWQAELVGAAASSSVLADRLFPASSGFS